MKTIGIILRNYETKDSNAIYGVRDYLINYLRKYNISIMFIPFDFLNSDNLNINKNLIKLCDGIILPGRTKKLWFRLWYY